MENTNSLKDLAMGYANPIMQNPQNYAETELVNPEMDAPMTHVGDTPVIIAPNSPKTGLTFAQRGNDLMRTPTPSTVGLDMDTLSSPVANLQPYNSPVRAANPELEGISQQHLDLLAEVMPDLDVHQRIEIGRAILNTESGIVRDLVISMGLTPEEASTAALNRIRKQLVEAYENNKTAESTVGVVTINKSDDPNNLGLTKEEHQKLEKVKKVRLVVVEDLDLANITIERPAEEHKADYIKSIEGSLSKYAVPMPMLGDFIGFKGAQMVEMVNIVNYEDARIDEIISTKASLIYEKLMGGVVMQKYDSSGKSIMSYNEFANKFPYQDIDMALYGILCASSMEENSTSLTCTACSHQWMQNYNLKALLKLDEITPAFKERVDGILKNKSNDIEMRKLYEAMRKAKRFKSPFTNNIYDLSYPTIARATNLLKRVDENDSVMTYLSAVALYLSRILIYNESKGTYIEVTAEETSLMLETMKTLSNEDVNMLAKQIREDLYYAPQFELPATCPSCGKVSKIPVSVEHLIFLTARDSMVEIDN